MIKGYCVLPSFRKRHEKRILQKNRFMNKLFLFLLFVVAQSHAQRNLSIQEAIPGSDSYRSVERLKNLKFTAVSGFVSWERKDNPAIMLTDLSGKQMELLLLEDYKKALIQAGQRGPKGLPNPQWKSAVLFDFYLDGKKWEFDVKKKLARQSTDTAQLVYRENEERSSIPTLFAYTKENNIVLHNNGRETQITTDGNSNLIYGHAVHRNEFGIEKGLFFSPKSGFLAFYRMDQSMVSDYPIINWLERPAKNENIKYPFAGDKSHHVKLGIYDIKKGATIYVNTGGDPEQYLTNVCWSPDEQRIFIALVNRDQNEMNLNEYDAQTGAFIRTLFSEKDDKYIEPLHPMVFLKNDPTKFIWQSNRDGFKHLYLYSISGKLIRQLTLGKWEVKDHNGFDASGRNYFFHANMTSPIDQNFCRVELASGKVVNLTPRSGFHRCVPDASRTWFIDHFSDASTPGITFRTEVKSGKSTELFRSPDPIADVNKATLQMFTIPNEEGTSLYCRMFLPPGFDATKKYPTVVYLYNGPHSQLVTNSYMGGADMWYQYMAQCGFIMFTLDGRGTSHRGKAFEQAIHRRLGEVEMKDQLSGVNWLKSNSYVDANRIGVHGWSYGGFMTTSLMTHYAGVFKAGVAGGPVIDWSLYEIMYGERYMDSPLENKSGYEENNLLNHISKLKGRLLVIHGADDDVVVWQHSLKLLHKSVEAGVHIDYYVYPGHKHNVRGPERVHLMEKISNYFIEQLN